jgi:hypothetical protein
MAKNKVSEWSNISDNNLDVGGINIADDMPPSFVNDAMREMMAQIRQWQSGLYEEPLTIKGDLDLQGGMTLNGQAGTSGQFLMSKGDGTTPQWGSATIPDAFSRGMIVLWSGTTVTIPTGWRLCDGGGGTPDLRDRFVIGAGNTYPVGGTGGTKDATLVSHSHTISSSSANAGNHAHTISGNTGGGGSHSHTYTGRSGSTKVDNSGMIGAPSYPLASTTATTSTIGNHTHSVSGSTSTTGNHKHTITSTCGSAGTNGTGKNLPPYYALAYIMRL